MGGLGVRAWGFGVWFMAQGLGFRDGGFAV